MNKARIFLALFFLVLNFNNCWAESYSNIPAVIHVQSNISDGRLSIDEIVDLARVKGIKVVVLTDTLLRRWEYGMWPLSRFLKRVFEEGSVIKFGVKRYLKEVREAQAKYPDMLVMAAVEVAPFYFWKGNYLDKSLTLYAWHKKFLVLGLKNVTDFRDMPIVGNYSLFPQALDHWLNFLPVGMVVLGFLLIKIKRKRRFTFGGQVYSNTGEPFKYPGYLLVILGVILLLGAFSFPLSAYDPYHGDKGIKPYQNLIDYVTKRNGLVFWTHPEANYSSNFAGARVITPPYKNDLQRSFNYTGFAGIYYDNSTATKAGDLWDRMLNEYCLGKRKKPVWIFGEVGWDGSKKDWVISGIETILLLKEFGENSVLDALSSGKMYAKLNLQENNFSLEKFCILSIDKRAFMGDELETFQKPRILIKAGIPGYTNMETKIKLIRDGSVIKEFKAKGNKIALIFQDKGYSGEKKAFYRLEINNDACLILTNPIFVSG